jgi:N6-adenosine-specific RNA methylase IME4
VAPVRLHAGPSAAIGHSLSTAAGAPAFRVLVADPPWAFADRLPGPKRGAAAHYPCLRLAEIEAFPLPTLATDALLFLWRVSAMPAEALAVCRAWGFVPKAELVWVKTAKERPHDQGPRLAIGMGHYTRGAHETCLIATRGRPKVRDRSVRSVFFAPRTRHSAKPDAFYAIVERMAAGPHAELFARRTRPGWASWGNELAEAHPPITGC